MITQLISVGW